MAGSYHHVVGSDGSLKKIKNLLDSLETYSGDVYECVEEMYGMIHYLANELEDTRGTKKKVPEFIEEAQKNYKLGLGMSPTERYQDVEL